MNLPHGEYLLFAKELVETYEEYVVVYCSFPIKPTLAMFLEASAQATAGFNSNKNIKMGFLTMGKDMKILDNIVSTEYLVKVQKDVNIGNYHQFIFDAVDKTTEIKVARGTFTLQIEE